MFVFHQLGPSEPSWSSIRDVRPHISILSPSHVIFVQPLNGCAFSCVTLWPESVGHKKHDWRIRLFIVSVLLSATVNRGGVSRMRDFSTAHSYLN